jgi:hypothetical protein
MDGTRAPTIVDVASPEMEDVGKYDVGVYSFQPENATKATATALDFAFQNINESMSPYGRSHA